MDEQVLRYDKMVEDALRSVVRQALTIAATEGLPGAHHFYLTFETGAPGESELSVRLAKARGLGPLPTSQRQVYRVLTNV